MAEAALLAAGPATAPAEGNDLLARARKYVESSDRYLHHSVLRRGMKGYGRTVFEGTKIDRFEVEIVSVMTNWGPHQDVILARLSTNGLEHSGVIAGMSGSPVFVKDPADGKDKIIGAVAFAYRFQKEPLCGIQPITQMLAGSGMFNGRPAASGPASAPASGPAASAAGRAEGWAPESYLKAVLGPRKLDFSQIDWRGRPNPAAQADAGTPALAPLATPVMICGLSREGLSHATKLLQGAGLMPVQAGGVGAAEAKAAGRIKLEPGAAVSIPLVTGDADFCAVGTVTDVIGDRVIAFGHSMFGEGEVTLPMGPAYVHAVIPSMMSSFKLSSSLEMTGCVTRDEEVGVTGTLGEVPSLIPLTVTVDWSNKGAAQAFRFDVIRHRYMTAWLVRMLIYASCRGWHDLPEQHVVRHSIEIDFGKLGKYVASNISSDSDVYDAVSDASRPLSALLNNPFGPPPHVESIKVNVSIDAGRRRADILDFKLDGKAYRPGEELTGTVIIRPFRQARQTMPVRFKLPEDLPEGDYSLTVCDWDAASWQLASEMPHRYAPRTVEDLFEAIQRSVQPQCNDLYLRLKLRRGGLAVGTAELPDLPASKAQILAEAVSLDSKSFTNAVVRTVRTGYVLYGRTWADFQVSQRPRETSVRQASSKQ